MSDRITKNKPQVENDHPTEYKTCYSVLLHIQNSGPFTMLTRPTLSSGCKELHWEDGGGVREIQEKPIEVVTRTIEVGLVTC